MPSWRSSGFLARTRMTRFAPSGRRSTWRGPLEQLNVELDREYGIRIRMRTGVNIGEVMTGKSADRQRFVTGGTVNVAARSEQAAQPDEVIRGRATYRLVRDAVEVQELAPLDLKGKSEPIPAYRLVQLHTDSSIGVVRRLDAAFVGRVRAQRLLLDAYARVVDELSGERPAARRQQHWCASRFEKAVASIQACEGSSANADAVRGAGASTPTSPSGCGGCRTA
jgi:Adenylate and Guanylate cyclase catalytic domain